MTSEYRHYAKLTQSELYTAIGVDAVSMANYANSVISLKWETYEQYAQFARYIRTLSQLNEEIKIKLEEKVRKESEVVKVDDVDCGTGISTVDDVW